MVCFVVLIAGIPDPHRPLSLVGPHFCDIGSDDLVELVLQHSSQWDGEPLDVGLGRNPVNWANVRSHFSALAHGPYL